MTKKIKLIKVCTSHTYQDILNSFTKKEKDEQAKIAKAKNY